MEGYEINLDELIDSLFSAESENKVTVDYDFCYEIDNPEYNWLQLIISFSDFKILLNYLLFIDEPLYKGETEYPTNSQYSENGIYLEIDYIKDRNYEVFKNDKECSVIGDYGDPVLDLDTYIPDHFKTDIDLELSRKIAAIYKASK